MLKADTLQHNIKIKYQTESFITRLLNDMDKYDYNIPTNVGENISQIYSLLYPPDDTVRNDKFNFVINAKESEKLSKAKI